MSPVMFPVAGIEKMAGGDTGDEPYKGKHGQERWQKMRENVIKEWEAEQGMTLPWQYLMRKLMQFKGKKAGSEQSQQSASNDGKKSVGAEEHVHVPHLVADAAVDDHNAHHSAGGNAEEKTPVVAKDAKAETSRLHKLKDKLFRH